MTPTAQQIVAMLDRKQQIERGPYMQAHAMAGAQQQWAIDAVELLLQIELERQQGAKP
jgi:hypothetical protein